MSTLSTRYAPADIENKWYQHWLQKGYFHSEPDEREPFSIVIPPPNVTGVLHMGHILNNTIQDTLIRKARLDGKNACWVPGTDHASIATEAKVVRWLRAEKGLKKSDVTREEFIEYAWQWTHKYGGIILEQLRRLGSSCDWERTAFTMDEVRSEGVLKVFVDLYHSNKLYRDFRMVNWDVEAKTVLSNEEVIYGEEQAQLYHVFYKVEGSENEGVVIATQRPETIPGDTAIAVHPKDPRYAHLKGKKLIVPMVHRAIPVIFDEYVDREFGTGALKVTPAHDPNDYDLGKKHGLETIDILNDDGFLNEKSGVPELIGKERFVARKLTKKLLEAEGCLVKLEDYKTKIGRSERTGSVVEPKLSLQWYVDMKALAKPAADAVENDTIEFFPKQFKNMYRSWMDGIRDWCISRQLWWGHRIPAWYLGSDIFVALTAEEALAQAKTKTGNNALTINDLRQEEDVLDTWFSSWLWPITVFDGFNPDSKDFKYYYPTNVLVTGWDIIFLWVARMAMAGYEWKNELPFKNVYFTGMVRDINRKKMSKSLGNSPDALALLDLYGADGVRFGMLATAPAGGDLIFDAPYNAVTKTTENTSALCEQGRNFCNKLWNASRLIKGWKVDETLPTPAKNELARRWMTHKKRQVLVEIEENFKQFRLSEALMTLYKFIWDDFCSWYLEMIKPDYEQPMDHKTLETAIDILDDLMIMLHPFMPFITEEIYHQLKRRTKDCIISKYPKTGRVNADLLHAVESAKGIIVKVREIRNNKGLKQRELLDLYVQSSDFSKELLEMEGMNSMILKAAVLTDVQMVAQEPANAVSFIVGTDKFYLVLKEEIDVAAERAKLLKELENARGFLRSVEVKLNNQKFVANAAAAVLAKERQKWADGQARVSILEESLAKLN
jgi:valyl-tRNA synthetase